jgi:hypothetical protein
MNIKWRISSWSKSGNCVEVGDSETIVLIRNSKNPNRRMPSFPFIGWEAFIKGNQMPKSSKKQSGDWVIPVWIAIGIISALIIGESAGILAWLSGDKVPAAILAGGGAFVATITVVVLIIGLFRRV